MRVISSIVVTGALGMAEIAMPACAQEALNAPQAGAPAAVLATTVAASAAATVAMEEQSLAATVQVSGVRQSLQNALQRKRNADVISDAISAEDLGKFPDQNLAESLQHITGVQISRSNGEGQKASIRGLDPQFNRVLFNGRELTSPTGDRSFSFSGLSADFISALEVYKSPSADMPEGGLAGTINVKTAKPLDIGKRKLVMTLEGHRDQNAQSTTPHGSVLFNDVFADKTLGLMLGVDFDKKSYATQQYVAYGVESRTLGGMAPVISGGNGTPLTDTIRFNHAAVTGQVVGTAERKNVLATLQFKPNANFDGYLNMLYSEREQIEKQPSSMLRFTNIAGPAPRVVNYVNEGGMLTFLDADGVDQRNAARANNQKDTIFSPAAGFTYKAGDWKVDTEVSTSRAKRVADSLNLEVIARANVSEDLRKDPTGIPSITFGRGYDPMNPANYAAVGVNGAYQQPNSENNTSARFDVAYKLRGDFLKSLQFGAKYSKNTEAVDSSFLAVSAKDLAGLLGVPYNAAIEGGSFNAAPFMVEYAPPNFLSGAGSNATFPAKWISSDLNLLLQKVPLSKLLAMSPPTANLASVYAITETTKAAYGKADFEALDGALSGNVGVRVVKTDQRSSGYAPDLSKIVFSQQGATTTIPNVTATTVTHSYTDVLPSLNVRYDLADGLVARLAAARVLARPNLAVLAPNTSVNANVRTITGGNPNVAPFKADQLDLSLEWYLQHGGLLSGATFYKDVKNFIVSTSRTTNLTVNLAEGGGTTTLPFTVMAPDNGGGSKVKGFELGYQQPLTFLPQPFKNFGTMVNYTFVDASPVQIVAGGPLIALPGVSKNNYNAIVYYEDSTFGARLSYTFRDKFVVDSSSYFGDGEFTDAYKQMDFSMSYKVSDAVSLSFNVLNVLDSALTKSNKFGTSRGLDLNGRRFNLGAHFTY